MPQKAFHVLRVDIAERFFHVFFMFFSFLSLIPPDTRKRIMNFNLTPGLKGTFLGRQPPG